MLGKEIKKLEEEIKDLENIKEKVMDLKNNENVGVVVVNKNEDEYDNQEEVYCEDSDNLLIKKELDNEVIIAFKDNINVEISYADGEWNYYYNRLDPDVPPEFNVLYERIEEWDYKIEKNKIRKSLKKLEIIENEKYKKFVFDRDKDKEDNEKIEKVKEILEEAKSEDEDKEIEIELDRKEEFEYALFIIDEELSKLKKALQQNVKININQNKKDSSNDIDR